MKRSCLFLVAIFMLAVSLLAQETAKPPFSLLWKYTTTFLQGSIVQPLVDGDTLYLAAGNDVYAIYIQTGETKWRFTLPVGVSVRVTPLLYKDYILVPASDGNIYVLDKTGKQVRLISVQAGVAVCATPILVGNLLVFPCLDSTLYAVDPETTDVNKMLKWKFRAGDDIPRSAVYGKGLIFFESSDIYLYALTEKGELKWKVALPSPQISSSPVLGDKYLYATAGNTILFLNPLTGREVRRVNLPDLITATPLLVDNILYVGCKDGKLYAIDAIKGKPIEGYKPYDAGISITTSPVLYGDYIYFGTANGLLVAIDKKGKLRWQYRTAPALTSAISLLYPTALPASQQFPIYSAPLWAQGYLFVINDLGVLHCFTSEPLDVSPPIISDIWPEGGPMSGLPVPLTISAVLTDEGSGVDSMSIIVKVDGKIIPPKAYKFDPNTGKLECDYNPSGAPGIPIPEGEHTVSIKVSDWFGNSAEKEWKFTIDNSLAPGAGRGQTPGIYIIR